MIKLLIAENSRQQQPSAGPKAWIGCLAAYNSGRLHGAWVDLDCEITFEDELREIVRTSPAEDSEELWVMDHEGIPLSGECSPSEALRLGLLVEEVCNDRGLPIEVLSYVLDCIRGEPTASDVGDYIDDKYHGQYESEEEFVIQDHEDSGTMPAGEFAPYIDWGAMARDWFSGEFYSVDLSGGEIAVFRSC